MFRITSSCERGYFINVSYYYEQSKLDHIPSECIQNRVKMIIISKQDHCDQKETTENENDVTL